MKLLTIEQARAHCRADANDDLLLTIYVNAAEAAVEGLANRKIFATPEERVAAIADLPTVMAEAYTAHIAALNAAASLPTTEDKELAVDIADAALNAAKSDKNRTLHSIVVNDDILSAVLLLTGHFYRNREENVTGQGEVAQPLVMGAENLMYRYRYVGET